MVEKMKLKDSLHNQLLFYFVFCFVFLGEGER